MMSSLARLPVRVLCKAGLGPRLLRADAGAPVVLLYHSVTTSSRGLAALDGKHLMADRFRGQLEMFRRRRRVVALAELLEALRRGTDTRGMLAITFDDGYVGNCTCAAPILADFRMPATFFIATGFIGTERWMWTDRLEAALDAAPAGEFIIPSSGERLRLGEPRQRMTVLRRIKSSLKRLHWREADARAREIEHAVGFRGGEPTGLYRFMSWDQVRALATGGFEIGAHTVNHVLLSRVPRHEAEQEIIASRDQIIAELGRCSATFCYPNGKRSDYTAETVEFCRGHFTAALSSEAGAARPQELFEVRRLGVGDGTSEALLASRIVQAH
jgi:peptidoglycan/xylan/chitin deacetylase (PgdA/CDA1 family)